MLGEPKLYDLQVVVEMMPSIRTMPQFSSAYHSQAVPGQRAPRDKIAFTTRTGFRTIHLVETPYSQQDIERGITPGDQWHFNINGKAFYTLGTNIIPFDPFYARTTTEQVKWILESAVMSGQNMVRPSHPGLLESNSHYVCVIAEDMGRRYIPTVGLV